jgi:hypothetical protein
VLWRSGDARKANPPRGGGAKPMDLSRREVAGLPKVVGAR